MWEDFLKVSIEVTSLTRQNPNTHAKAILSQMTPLWEKADKELEQAATFITEHSKQFLVNVPKLRQANKEIVLLRVFLNQYVGSTNSKEVDDCDKTINDLIQSISENLKSVIDSTAPEEGGAMVVSVRSLLRQDILENIKEIQAIIQTKANIKSAELFSTKGIELRTRFINYAANLVEEANNSMIAAISNADALSRSVNTIMIAVGVVGIVLGLIFAYIVIMGITRRLNSIIGVVSDSSEQVFLASSQISTASQGLAEGSTEQAASLEQTSSALEQMASMTRQSAENANKMKTPTKRKQRCLIPASC